MPRLLEGVDALHCPGKRFIEEMKPGITRNELLRAFPGAPSDFIERNIGNTDWNYVRAQRPLVNGVNDAFEQMQRRDKTGRQAIPIFEQKLPWVCTDCGKPIPCGCKIPSVENKPNKTVVTMTKTSSGWLEVGGKRIYVRSHWERNYCFYLECLKVRGHIEGWEYEPKTFWFKGIKRGVCSYKPDFLVVFYDHTEYREVKGYLDRKSKTKLKRMKKYYPSINLRVIDGAWFKEHGPVLSQCVPGWTKKGKKTVASKI
jgi:hypothetical protein